MASDLSLDVDLPLAPREREPEVLARAIAGDPDAFARLVRPYESLAYRVAAAITGQSADAEEAMQNGFVKAYRSLHRFRTGAAFKPWLLKIVVNEAHNVLRSERRHARLGERATEQHRTDAASPNEAVIAREEVDIVLDALARLPGPDRLALALRYFAEMPDSEAAALVGISTEAYRVRLVRAVPELGPLASGVALPYAGRSVPVDAVEASVPFPVSTIASLAAPEDARVRDDIAGGLVTLVYDRGRIRLSQWRTADVDARIAFVPVSGVAEGVTVGRLPALWIEGTARGTYTLVGADGAVHRESFDVGTGALLWNDHGMTFLLQGAGSKADAISLATEAAT